MSQLLYLPRPPLLNPAIFDDTVFGDLYSVVGLATGKLFLKYERGSLYPLTLGASRDAGHLNGIVQRFEEFLACMELYCDPLKISALGAVVKPVPQPQAYRVMPAAVGCRELFAQAHLHSEFFGLELQLECSLEYSAIGDQGLSCSFEANVHEHEVLDRQLTSAMEAYRGDAEQIWLQIVETTLGPWAIANGVRSMAFEGRFTVDSDCANRLAENYRLECERNDLWSE